jgi:hypothetical protein
MFGSDEDTAKAILGSPEEPDADEGDTSDEEMAAEDVLAAFAQNDPKALAAALKSFFLIVDSQPHDEGGQ